MPADDIYTLPSPPADARLTYGSDPNQFGELRVPKSAGLTEAESMEIVVESTLEWLVREVAGTRE